LPPLVESPYPQGDDTEAPLHIGVVGLGYVGAVTAACLTHLGHRVEGFEQDRLKTSRIDSGHAPFFEPDLDSLLAAGITSGRLTVSRDLQAAVEHLDLILICVGTPSRPDGAHDWTQLERVAAALRSALIDRRRTKPLTVAIRSTVTPGTTARLRARFFRELPQIAWAYVPEFLREGSAVRDFFDPALIVVGADTPEVARIGLAVHRGIDARKSVVPIRTAELVKGACNAFHALKTAFANEAGAVAAACGIDPEEVMSVLCADTRLNISSAYLRPGFPFGGSCLPKDVRALNRLAHTMGLSLPLLDAILQSNHEHVQRAVHRVLDAGFTRVGLIGLSFKDGTDDMRESAALRVAAMLKDSGLEVRAFDDDIRPELLHGVNLQALEEVLGSPARALAPSMHDLVEWADGLVVCKRPAAWISNDIVSARPIIDLTRIAPCSTAT
jgi:GDP-mannose 6-dehydrogenase